MLFVVTYLDVDPSSVGRAIELLDLYGKGGDTHTLQEFSRRNHSVIVRRWEDEAFHAYEDLEHAAECRSKVKAIENIPFDQRVDLSCAVRASVEATGIGNFWVVTHVDGPPPRRGETEVVLSRLAPEIRKVDSNRRYDL